MRLALILAVLLAATAVHANAADPKSDPRLTPQANQAFLAAWDKAHVGKPGAVIKPSGLRYQILKNGFGWRPRATDYVTVYYTGKLINGETFDGTEEGMPVRFKVNNLISGWAEALTLMKVGDRWQIVIPYKLGYGEAGSPPSIPPMQTLVFEVELLKVTPPRLRPADPNNPDDKHAGEDMGPADND